jgi:flavin-binding protein dodecin
MTNNVYKQTKIIGTSSESIENAISFAIDKASKTVRNMEWFRVLDTRGKIENGKVSEYQVILELGFKLE